MTNDEQTRDMGRKKEEPLDLDAIEARANAATPGPWRVFTHRVQRSGFQPPPEVYHPKAIEDAPGDIAHGVPVGASAEDTEFIAHARTDVPALVAEVRRCRALPAIDALIAKVETASSVETRTLTRADGVTEIVTDFMLDAQDAFLNKAPDAARECLLRAAAWALLAVRQIEAEAGQRVPTTGGAS